MWPLQATQRLSSASWLQVQGAMRSPSALARECAQKQKAFEDPDFPPVTESLLDSSTTKMALPDVEWCRLPDCRKKSMKMFPSDPLVSDVRQGMLNDTTLLAALNAIQRDRRLLSSLVVNSLHTDVGLFVFRLFWKGRWEPVLIDDWIPCRAESKSPLFGGTVDNGTTWVMLLEKAVAKLLGNYERIQTQIVSTEQCLELLTGGVLYQRPVDLQHESLINSEVQQLDTMLQVITNLTYFLG